MYKLLLCWRYLRTRYIALASIVSVMLGVGTMIVVNSVMAGFSHEMETRMHGILSDLAFEGRDINGFQDPDWVVDNIQRKAGQWIEGMTPTVQIPGLLSYEMNGGRQTRQVMLIGIDEKTHSSVSDFGKFLQHPENRKHMTFELRDGGYDVRDHSLGDKAPLRLGMEKAGWEGRRAVAQRQKEIREAMNRAHAELPNAQPTDDAAIDGSDAAGNSAAVPADPFAAGRGQESEEFDAGKEQHGGLVAGFELASMRDHEGTDHVLLAPGCDVTITTSTAGTPPKAANRLFTVTDLYESKMSEYDASFVFLPIKEVQDMRGMGNNVTSIQIKLKPGVDPNMVRDELRKQFQPEIFGVYTWRDKQGAILAAVQMERAVLNILLFMIIAVAGFGILAIFFMIVVEKTRDVGILKSLGASSQGIMGIFLGYGLSLGMVGAGVGMALGLLFVHYINEIRSGLEWLTGQTVFDPAIYYFYEIPTIVDAFTVSWIMAGAILIAVVASVLPALRAARLHPVEALRYE
jgi:lipoprotein-releasing system permease protein